MNLKAVVIGIAISTGLWGAEDKAQPDRWKGLILDQSTPADAAEVLGKPKSDKVEKLPIYPIDRWFDPELKKTGLRRLTFKEVPGFKEVGLYFRGDRLASILLIFKDEVAPTALPNIYGVEFRPMVGGFIESMGGIERHEGNAFPTSYPAFYNLVAMTERTVVNAYIRNSGVKAALRRSMIGPDTAGGGFPGTVNAVQLVSRTLENRAGADLLK